MPWPFSSTSSPSDKSDEQKRGSSANDSRSWGDLLPAPDTPLTAAARDWAPVILAGVGSLAAFVLYQSYLRRFPGASHVQENFFRRRTLFGKATSVGDGDGFHLYHTPGGRLAGWDWLRKVPESRADLKGKTVGFVPGNSRLDRAVFANLLARDFDPPGWRRCARRPAFRPPRAALR